MAPRLLGSVCVSEGCFVVVFVIFLSCYLICIFSFRYCFIGLSFLSFLLFFFQFFLLPFFRFVFFPYFFLFFLTCSSFSCSLFFFLIFGFIGFPLYSYVFIGSTLLQLRLFLILSSFIVNSFWPAPLSPCLFISVSPFPSSLHFYFSCDWWRWWEPECWCRTRLQKRLMTVVNVMNVMQWRRTVMQDGMEVMQRLVLVVVMECYCTIYDGAGDDGYIMVVWWWWSVIVNDKGVGDYCYVWAVM